MITEMDKKCNVFAFWEKSEVNEQTKNEIRHNWVTFARGTPFSVQTTVGERVGL